MANHTTNSDIDPRLEMLLKEELSNRAKKIDAMRKWKQKEKVKNSSSRIHLKVIYGTVASIAALFVVGFFLFQNGQVQTGNSELTNTPVFRGKLVDTAIYDTLEKGDTANAISMIQASRLECQKRVLQLDSMEQTPENQSEIQDMRTLIEQELNELDKLENDIKKNTVE